MNLLDSLLDAIVRLNGDALVMHVGEKPYVVTTSEAANESREPLAWGQVELSSRVLTSEAVAAMLNQILPIDQRAALAEFGATEYDVAAASNRAERFTIVAARGGDDVWLEVRRRAKQVPLAEAEHGPALDTAPADQVAQDAEGQPAFAANPAVPHPTVRPWFPADPPVQQVEAPPVSPSELAPSSTPDSAAGPGAVQSDHEVLEMIESVADPDYGDDVMTEGDLREMLRASTAILAFAPDASSAFASSAPGVDSHSSPLDSDPADRLARDERAALPEPVMEPSTPDEDAPPVGFRPPAMVVPLSRPFRPASYEDTTGSGPTWLRLLHAAASRGAASLHLMAQLPPLARLDGEFITLGGEPAIEAALIERLTVELARTRRTPTAGESDAWISDVPGVGRVRCLAFRDHRGPGLVFRMMPPRVLSAEQLGLAPEVQALCSEAEGLVLVAGGRRSGKGTLIASFVDVINRTRSDHVITAESQMEFVHEHRRSLVSQREVRGDAEALAAAVKVAMQEEPDVLVVDELRTPELVSLALEAADSGCLVFGALQSASAASAVQRVIEMFPSERRDQAQALLAGALRGVISLVLLRKRSGGRVAAREILLNTPPVANLILEGRTSQLPAAIDAARRHGMMPFAESLAALVRDGTVHPSHAFRKAPNREQFLAALRRDGIDTTIVERLA